MPRSNNSNSNSNSTSNRSYSPRRASFKPYPHTPTIQSQPIQQRSFFGNIVDGFAFGTGSTIARNMFSSSNTSTETKIIEKETEKRILVDCTEFNKCNEFKENGDKFLYNDCIKKLTNKVTDYEICLLSK
jgi:hypothetical protein